MQILASSAWSMNNTEDNMVDNLSINENPVNAEFPPAAFSIWKSDAQPSDTIRNISDPCQKGADPQANALFGFIMFIISIISVIGARLTGSSMHPLNYLAAAFLMMYVSLLIPFLAAAQAIQPLFVTEPVAHDSDDPAVWINKAKPSESLIFGTDKQAAGALYVFNLEGKIIKDKVPYELNFPTNVDVAYDMQLGNEKVDIAVTTERGTGKLRIFSVPDMQAIDNGGIPVFEGETQEGYNEPMGIGLYKRSSDGNIYAIVSRKAGPVDGTYLWQYLLEDDGQGHVKGTLLRKFGKFSGDKEIEAIAVDNELGYVYYSDEKVGVRKYHANPDKGDQELVLFATTGFDNDHEGIAIYKIDDGTGYILVSDQKANEVHVFAREGSEDNPHHHSILKVVKLEANLIDGIEVVNYPLSPHFMNGLFLSMSDDKTFHLYRWEDLAGNDLKIEPPGREQVFLPPVLSAPANAVSAIPVLPTLNWYEADEALAYQLQVSTTDAFINTVYDQSGITGTSFSLNSSLSGNSVYFWRVRALKASRTSDWSAVWSFTTTLSTTPGAALVGHWKMDEGSGTTLLDASEYGNNGATIRSPEWVPGVEGLALKLNGTNQYATVSDHPSLDITEAITLSAWIRPEKTSTQNIIKKSFNGETDGYELSLSSSGQVFFRFNQASSEDAHRLNSVASYPANGNTWMHIAATYDGSEIRMYINGVENSAKVLTDPPSIKTNTLVLTLGAQEDGKTRFQGALDDVRVYNSALDAAEIRGIAGSTFIINSIGKEGQEIGQGIELYAYPNPFTAQAIINFSTPKNSMYKIVLCDLRGSQLLVLQEGHALQGELNSVTLDGTDLKPGLYIIKFQTNRGSSVLKLLHVK